MERKALDYWDLKSGILYQNTQKQKLHFYFFEVWLIFYLVKNAFAACVSIPEHSIPLITK